MILIALPSLYRRVPDLMIAHADRFPDDPSAVSALLGALGHSSLGDPRRKIARERLERVYATSPVVAPHIRRLAASHFPDDKWFFRLVAERNPDKRIRALGWRGVINSRTHTIKYGFQGQRFDGPDEDLAKLPPERRKVALEIREWIAGYRAEVEEAKRKLASPDLAGVLADADVGAKAPPLTAADLGGRPTSLAAYRGRVVVIDFWYTTCGPCKRFVPTANGLVAEMKGRPFAVVGLNTDADAKTAREFVAKTAMPWDHWWVARDSAVFEAYDVEAYPTILVIDHEGVIRHRQVGYDVKTDKLAEIVSDLVKKAEAAKKPRPEPE